MLTLKHSPAQTRHCCPLYLNKSDNIIQWKNEESVEMKQQGQNQQIKELVAHTPTT
jgi:hypothetical protein